MRVFILTHLYPCFIAAHLYFGTSDIVWQLMFTVIPFTIFAGLLHLWKVGHVLSITERFNVGYLIYNMVVMGVYYILCSFSKVFWIYNHNVHTAIFVLLNLGFYLLFYRKLKHCEF